MSTESIVTQAACEQRVNLLGIRRARAVLAHRPALTTNRNGAAIMAKPIPTDISDDVKARFWAKVDVRGPDECWLWNGGKAGEYGRFGIRGVARPAHQVTWEIAHAAPFPAGKVACHKCDNPGCVNPLHIWAGSQSENLRDCVAKGRHREKPRTHCKRGHQMDPDNRILMPGGGSRCRACSRVSTRERTRRWRERRRQAHG